MIQGYCRSFSILYTYWSLENILGNSKQATKKSVDNAAPVKTEKTEIHKSVCPFMKMYHAKLTPHLEHLKGQ